jgi:hypothetical protein
MGRIVTPKYRVEVRTNNPAVGLTPFAWQGRPTQAKLEAWRQQYNASFQLGGVNAHVSTEVVLHIVSAKIVHQATGRVVAETTMPMFEVV